MFLLLREQSDHLTEKRKPFYLQITLKTYTDDQAESLDKSERLVYNNHILLDTVRTKKLKGMVYVGKNSK